MDKSALQIVGPVFDLIEKMASNERASVGELKKLLAKLVKKRDEAIDELKAFDKEFERIRNLNTEQKEKIEKLNKILDDRMDNVSAREFSCVQMDCEDIYRGYWFKLDVYSRRYLTMAHYLFRIIEIDNEDFSPAVLQFGRAIENELVLKIYTGYIDDLSKNNRNLQDSGKLYSQVKNAVASYNTTGKYYISARTMVKYLTYLADSGFKNDYNDALKNYLNSNNIDKEPISQEDFTNTADYLFGNYRNAAAHPGQIIMQTGAEDCRDKTKDVLGKFMGAVK